MQNRHLNDVQLGLSQLRGQDLLQELSQIQTLPNQGILAGQSVATLVMRRLGISRRGQINDLDVFHSNHTPIGLAMFQARQGKNHSWKVDTTAHFSHMEVNPSGTYSGLALMIKNGYHVYSTQRNDLLNEICFLPSDRRPYTPSQLTQLVIQAFDLNCVQVGINLETGKLEWTDEFAQFLASWELSVLNTATPFHTATRYFKKKAQLDCHGHDLLNMTACAVPWAFGHFDEIHEAHTSFDVFGFPPSIGRFGKKTYEDALVLPELAQWFKPSEIKTAPGIWTFEPVFNGQEGPLRKLHEMGQSWSKNESSFLQSSQLLQVNSSARIARQLVLPQSRSSIDRQTRFETIVRDSKIHHSTAESLIACSLTRGTPWLGKEALGEHDLKGLARLLDQHSDFWTLFWDIPLREQCAMAKQINALEDQYGEKAFGWVEALRRNQGEEACMNTLSNPDLLQSFCDNQNLKGERILTEKLPLHEMSQLALRLSYKLFEIQIDELNTPNQLENEGKEMHHCVGGYASSVESGHSRIIRLTGPQPLDRSTAELDGSTLIQPNTNQPVRVVQHRAHSNGNPSVSATSALHMVLATYGVKDKTKNILSMARAVCSAFEAQAIPSHKLKLAKGVLNAASKQFPQLGQSYQEFRQRCEQNLLLVDQQLNAALSFKGPHFKT